MRTYALPTLLVGVLLAGEVLAEDTTQWHVQLPALEAGDMNGDWSLDMSDPIYLMGHLFLGTPAPAPVVCGTEPTGVQNDANGDETLDVSDAIYLLDYLYSGGPTPVLSCGEGAAAQRIPFTAVEFFLPDDAPPERAWIADGVSHSRNDPLPGIIKGDLEGSVSNLHNVAVNIATRDGVLWGVATLEGSWMGRSGTLEGRYAGRLEGGLAISGQVVVRGTSGDLEGVTFIAKFEQPNPASLVLTGVVLDPGN